MADLDPATASRRIQQEFGLIGTVGDPDPPDNTATPEHLTTLLDALATMTAAIAAKRAELNDWAPDAAIRHWDRDLEKWRERLRVYRAQVSRASPGDRQAVLWGVTAPLLLGIYGGVDSTAPRRGADVSTPFILLQSLKVDAEFRQQRWDQLFDDIKAPILSTLTAAIPWALTLAAVVAVYYLGRK